MGERTFISEQRLLELAAGIQQPGFSSAASESPILLCAKMTASWLIGEIARGRNPSAAETRTYFEEHWAKTSEAQPRDAAAMRTYITRLSQIPHACWRLREILWTREILQPVLPYELNVGGAIIIGEYTVLRSSRRRRHAHVLYLRDGGIKRRPLVPDLVSFARGLDISRNGPELFRDWDVSTVGILHYWTADDICLEHRPDPDLAPQLLSQAVEKLQAARSLARL